MGKKNNQGSKLIPQCAVGEILTREFLFSDPLVSKSLRIYININLVVFKPFLPDSAKKKKKKTPIYQPFLPEVLASKCLNRHSLL